MSVEIKELVEISEKAGKMLRENYRSEREVRVKEDQSYVTSMDLKIEKFLKKELSEIDSSFSTISEETQNQMKNSKYSWVIDPLDGTTNYIHHIPIFAVMIALCEENKPIKGVVHFPIQKETLYAEKGGGAFLDGDEIKVSDTSMKNGLATFCSELQDEEVWKDLRKVKNMFSSVRILGSAAMNFIKVAEGDAEACIDFKIHPWDFLAPVLLVEEAGGIVTDLNGEKIDMETEDVVATNGLDHSKLLETLK